MQGRSALGDEVPDGEKRQQKKSTAYNDLQGGEDVELDDGLAVGLTGQQKLLAGRRLDVQLVPKRRISGHGAGLLVGLRFCRAPQTFHCSRRIAMAWEYRSLSGGTPSLEDGALRQTHGDREEFGIRPSSRASNRAFASGGRATYRVQWDTPMNACRRADVHVQEPKL